ncbi:MAG: MFS transporter [Polycyclovorans sp.]|jgi:UMF1 family MFS transporter|nr:MFS transporter [Gammaproteobacteria bacterium]MDP1543862.1 MFS transporter [Polycyclovorans sp.]
MATRKLAPAKEIVGWAMFDFANQAYTLLIVTVIFGDLFTRVIVGDAPDYRLGNLLWSLALAASYLLVVVAAPVAGAVMDFQRSRKRFLFMSYVATVVTTALLYFATPGHWWLGMVLIIASNFAYAIGESFIASFLPGLGPAKSLGWISGFGWGVGYVGGLVATAFALVFLGEVSAANFETIRWVGPFAAVFFLVAAIPTFVFVKERGRRQQLPPGESLVRMGFARVRQTLREMRHFQDLSILMVSVFFTMAGISIIISFAFIYGAQVIGWDEPVRVMMFVTVQVTATIGAIAFGFIQSSVGAKRTYMMTLLLWMLAILAIWQTPGLTALAHRVLGVDWQAQYVFLFAGVLSGLSLGSAQSAGRALVGILSPRSKASEMFGFWGLASKLAAVLGLVGLGLIQAALGLANAIVFCLLLFALGLVAVWRLDEARGTRVAAQWREGRPASPETPAPPAVV